MDSYLKKDFEDRHGIGMEYGSLFHTVDLPTHPTFDVPPLVVFTGFKGCGKTTASKFLSSAYGFKSLKFADGLKDMLRALGLNEREIEGDLKEEPCGILMGHTPRWAMQTLGTEWGRECISKDFWINLWVSRVRKTLHAGFGVVNDDMRFPNEAEAVKMLGGTIVRIYGKNDKEAQEDTHASESHYSTIAADYSLINRGTIGDLHRSVDTMVKWIRGKNDAGEDKSAELGR